MYKQSTLLYLSNCKRFLEMLHYDYLIAFVIIDRILRKSNLLSTVLEQIDEVMNKETNPISHVESSQSQQECEGTVTSFSTDGTMLHTFSSKGKSIISSDDDSASRVIKSKYEDRHSPSSLKHIGSQVYCNVLLLHV